MTSDTAGQAQMPCILSGARPRVLAEPGASLSSMPAPRSHPQAQEPGLSLPQVCGRLGAGLPQLLPPVHSVYLAGWFPPHPAEVTESVLLASAGHPLQLGNRGLLQAIRNSWALVFLNDSVVVDLE